MNWLDFVILAVVAWFTLAAYLSGLIRETVGLAAVILGIVLAGAFHDNVAENLAVVTGGGTGSEIASFLIIFIAIGVIGWVASLFLRHLAHMLFLGWADRTAGALFGFIKGVLVVQAVIVIFVLQPALGMEAVIERSTIGAFFLDTAPLVRALLPAEFDRAISEFAA